MNKYFLPLVILLSCWGCKSNQGNVSRVTADYQTVTEPEPSVVRIPLRIATSELEELVDASMTNLNLAAGMEDQRLDLVVTKAEEAIGIEVFNEQIRYRVPLKLDIAYNLGFAKPKAQGVLALDFISRFGIDSAWQLTTTTRLNSHEWLRQPKIEVAGFSLPITSVANYAIRQAEGTIERGIDQAVKQQLSLQSYVTDAWLQLQKPILVSPEYQAWLTIRPYALRMTPLQSSEKEIKADIILKARPRLVFQETSPVELPLPFPAFSYAEVGQDTENFKLNLGTKISYAEAERLSGISVVGEEFSSGNRKVTVQDLKLFGSGGQLMVELTTTGAYNGIIYLNGIPRYDAQRGKLKVDDLDFSLTTKNFLAKTAGWLLKGKLKRQLQDNMNEMLDDNLDSLKKQLEDQLRDQELAPGINLRGRLSQLSLANTYLTREGIEVVIRMDGNIDLDITGLTQLLPE